MSERPGPSAWLFDGRYYNASMGGHPDGMSLEIEDIAPAPGRGEVAEVIYNDRNDEMTVRVWTSEPLPLELIEQVTAEARRRLPPLPASE